MKNIEDKLLQQYSTGFTTKRDMEYIEPFDIDNIADNVTNELEIISLNLCPYFCPKKPDKNEPIKGKKTIAKSKIYPLIELISSTLIEPLFL